MLINSIQKNVCGAMNLINLFQLLVHTLRIKPKIEMKNIAEGNMINGCAFLPRVGIFVCTADKEKCSGSCNLSVLIKKEKNT